jgi:hypothetical protein
MHVIACGHVPALFQFLRRDILGPDHSSIPGKFWKILKNKVRWAQSKLKPPNLTASQLSLTAT